MAKNRNGIFEILSFIFGLVFGGLATLFFSTNEAGEIKPPLKTKLQKTKSQIKDLYDSDRLKAIYGKVSLQSQKQYREIQTKLSRKIDEVKEIYQGIDKEKYKDVVANLIADLKKEGSLTAAQLKKLTGFLQDDYRHLAAGKPKAKKAK